jgi:hypothetical protein
MPVSVPIALLSMGVTYQFEEARLVMYSMATMPVSGPIALLSMDVTHQFEEAGLVIYGQNIKYMPVSGPSALLSMGVKAGLVIYGQKYQLHASKRSHCSLLHG